MTGAVVLQRQGKDLLKHRTLYTLQLPVGWLMAKLVAGRLNISFSASFTFKYQSWGRLNHYNWSDSGFPFRT